MGGSVRWVEWCAVRASADRNLDSTALFLALHLLALTRILVRPCYLDTSVQVVGAKPSDVFGTQVQRSRNNAP